MDIAKLPKWAQDHIKKLEHDLAEAHGALQSRNGEFVGGKVLISPYNDRTNLVFPDHTSVRFVGEDHWRGYFDVRKVGAGIEVHSGSPMLIRPEVTNVVKIRLDD